MEGAEQATQAAHAQLKANKGPGAQVLNECRAALADDLNTPAAIAAMSATLRELNDLLYTRKVCGIEVKHCRHANHVYTVYSKSLCKTQPFQGRKAADRAQRLALGLAVIQQAVDMLGVVADQHTLDDLRSKALARYEGFDNENRVPYM